MVDEEKHIREDVLKRRYKRASKIIILLALLYFIWMAVNIISVYYFGYGNKWAFLTMNEWILSGIIFYIFLIVIILLFVLHHVQAKKKRIRQEAPQPVYEQGKRLHEYTLPEGSQGGIYSKTFVTIDEHNILKLRFQMIPPKELWQ